MHFQINKMCNALNLYKKIIIYGTGNYSREIYPHLVEAGLKDKIIYFTQTSEAQISSLDGIEVVKFDALNCDKAECIVLIAVSEVYANEIKQMLLEYQYINIISLIDYEWDCKRSEKLLCESTTFEGYCNIIADWYVETHIDSPEREVIVKELIDRGRRTNEEKDSNLIIMICGHLSSRTVRIAGALKKKQYNIVMLKYFVTVNSWCSQELQNINMKIYNCRCIEEMLYNALQYHPLTYFFEPSWGDCLWAAIMLKNKNYFGNVAIALYDVVNDGYLNLEEKHLETEKYTLENADGIVWRWFSKESLEKIGFKYKGKSIQFIDYCSSREKKENIAVSDSCVVKLCAVAGYGNDYIEKRTYSAQYIEHARIDEILEKIGNRQDCIFHFFVGGFNQKDLEICKQYEEQYWNFRLFIGTEHKELLERLEKYDYGCFMCIDGKIPEENVSFRDEYGNRHMNSIRNAYFDFLDAGLPIVTTNATKLWEFLSDYDVVVKMNLSNIDIDYLNKNKKYYKSNVEIARKALNIDNHIQELIDFFEDL